MQTKGLGVYVFYSDNRFKSVVLKTDRLMTTHLLSFVPVKT